MGNEIDKEFIDIIEVIDNKENKKDAEEVKIVSSVKYMKASAIQYFVNLFNSANEDDEILSLVRESIKEKIPTLEFSELRQLMNDFQKSSGLKNEQIISLFRANNQEISPLASILRDEASQDTNKIEEMFKGAKKEDIRNLDALNQMIKMIQETSEKMDQDDA